MKKIINWKLFFILLAASLISAFMVLPYIFALSPKLLELFSPALVVAQLIQTFILFSVAIFVGLLLYKRVGFSMPYLDRTKPASYLKSILKISVGVGILAGLLIIVLSIPFSSLSTSLLQAEMGVATWKGILASFYGGIAEEVLFRLFLMTLITWLLAKFMKTKEGRPTHAAVWTAIIISTVIFGLGHLGITSDLTAITPIVIVRAVVLNGVSVLFGWLYWKKGLESAMIAHFSTDIVIHVITPIVATVIVTRFLG